jgi:hypothetical protein
MEITAMTTPVIRHADGADDQVRAAFWSCADSALPAEY